MKLSDILLEIGEGNFHYPIPGEKSILARIEKDYNEGKVGIAAEAIFVTDAKIKYFINLDMSRAPKGWEVQVVFTSQDLGKFDIIKDYIGKFSKSDTLLRIPNYRHSYKLNAFFSNVKPKQEVVNPKQLANSKSIRLEDLVDTLGYGDVDFEYSQLMRTTKKIKDVYPGNVNIYTTNLPYVWLVKEKWLIADNILEHLLVDISNPQSKDFVEKIYNDVVENTSRNASGMTDKGEALKVVSTVAYFTKEVGKIIPFTEVYFNPAKRDEEGDKPLDQTGRGRLYLAFVKKQFPNAQVKASDRNIIIKLN
jgi:hypothetical protein